MDATDPAAGSSGSVEIATESSTSIPASQSGSIDVELSAPRIATASDGTPAPIGEVDSSPVHDAEGRIVAGVVTFHDVTQRKRRDEDMRFLASASEVLASSLDYEDTLDRVARLAVPHFADWCAVHMREEDGSIRLVVRKWVSE